jgi:hypothetical protein
MTIVPLGVRMQWGRLVGYMNVGGRSWYLFIDAKGLHKVNAPGVERAYETQSRLQKDQQREHRQRVSPGGTSQTREENTHAPEKGV